MLETRTIIHGDPEKPSLQATVSEATTLMGMRHSMLIGSAVAYLRTAKMQDGKGVPATDVLVDDSTETAAYLVRRFTWPNCLACVVASEGFDHRALTFEDFCLMPEQFVSKWEQAALELNPHWVLQTAEAGEQEKKDDSASEKSSPESS